MDSDQVTLEESQGSNQGQRDRIRRNDKGTRFSDADNRDRSREKRECTRIYISNVPYEFRWQELKDLFRTEVGDVEFVELFNGDNGKPRGCGIIEFKQPEQVQLAIEKMNKYDVNGRQLVVKDDYGNERDKCGRIIRNPGAVGGGGGISAGGGNRRDRDVDRMPARGISGGGGGYGNIGGRGDYGTYNTFGLSTSFLQGLGIDGPLHNKVFVANLDYKVDAKKLKQVFKLAGRIYNLDLSRDKEGNSRGFAVIEYEHPVEAVQAISMFDQQMLYERRMTVRLDRVPDKNEGMTLPEGLRSIGIGLGPNGEPLKDVSRNLPNVQQNTNQNISSSTAAVSSSNLGGLGSNMGNNLAATLSNVVGLSGALSNPLLSSANLSTLGLGIGSNNDLSSSNQGPSYTSSGNQFSFGSGNLTRNYDLGVSNSVRNYNTSSNDFGRGTSGFGGGMLNNGSARKSDTIVIKNLPPSCTWQTLRDKLRDIGEVTFAEIRGQDTGVVRFAKERDAELAIKLLNGSRFEGRTVDVMLF